MEIYDDFIMRLCRIRDINVYLEGFSRRAQPAYRDDHEERW